MTMVSVQDLDQFDTSGCVDPLPCALGDRIRVSYWVDARDWKYGTVKEVGRHCAFVRWDGGYESIVNLRQILHVEVVPKS